MGSQSRLRISTDGGITTVGFVDRNILDEANIQAIGEEIAGVIARSAPPKLVISFANVDHLSSAALGQLITINNKVREKGGQLRLAEIDPQIYEVFAITQLNKIFSIHDTAAEAIGSIT
jgi:anti-sigma B factor antagonist